VDHVSPIGVSVTGVLDQPHTCMAALALSAVLLPAVGLAAMSIDQFAKLMLYSVRVCDASAVRELMLLPARHGLTRPLLLPVVLLQGPPCC
jgi:hypothetical protein